MGGVDQVLLVESPGSVARGLQRVGRAGHGVGQVSSGRIFPKFRGDLLECAVIAARMLKGELEPFRMPCNALDVLAQQIAAHCVAGERGVDEIQRLVNRAGPYRELGRGALEAVLDMLSGRFPSSDFADLQTAAGLGPRHGPAERPQRGADDHAAERRHHPRPRQLRGASGSGRTAHRRAGRGDGVRDPRRRVHPARRVQLAGRGDHARPGHRLAGPRRARQAAVLARRRAGPTGGAGARGG